MYELENREFDFKRVNTQDALKIKSAMMILANEKSTLENIEKANKVIDDLAIKYLRTKDNKGNWLENIEPVVIESLFNNEFAIIEITAKFQERLQGFLSALPSFQHMNKKA
ncbi:hypothetical protein [uncultured Helicobacter sp.]|uniref:hypothetical protein n=1 Tax=uncultured Helicobacter sp. TaxID=175537 RepID=UPI002638FDEB|nr:hypothetical protein [uncultured Helicobacter sp.]